MRITFFILLFICCSKFGITQSETADSLIKSKRIYKFNTHDEYNSALSDQIDKFCYSESYYNRKGKLIKSIWYPKYESRIPNFSYRVSEYSYRSDTTIMIEKSNTGELLRESIEIKNQDNTKTKLDRSFGIIDYWGNLLIKDTVLTTQTEINDLENRNDKTKVQKIEPQELNSINYSFFRSKGELKIRSLDTIQFSYRTYFKLDSINTIEDYFFVVLDKEETIFEKVTFHYVKGLIVKTNFYTYKKFEWIKKAETEIERCCNDTQTIEFNYEISNGKRKQKKVRLTKLEFY